MVKYIILFLLSFCATSWIFKKVLKIALMKNIVDNPDARKIQRQPVPVLGGIAVFFGMLISLVVCNAYFNANWILVVMGLMVVVLYIGTLDDILSLSPALRFCLEVLVIVVMITCNDNAINNFHGLWGVWWIPEWTSLLVTVISCVGIINAINMIDGVNGLCSGYCIVTCCLYAFFFWLSQDFEATAMAIIAIGSLIPFFLHNVFGKASKMFLGDGGSMLMGMTMSVFTVELLTDRNGFYTTNLPELGLVPLSLAILAIPVFDTLRVMIMRILRKKSPFSPDKTHLHHLFFDFGFSHIGTTGSVILLNLFVVLAWLISYKLGCNINTQLYVVVVLAVSVTFVFYPIMRLIERRKGPAYVLLCKFGTMTHVGHTTGFVKISKFLDKNC